MKKFAIPVCAVLALIVAVSALIPSMAGAQRASAMPTECSNPPYREMSRTDDKDWSVFIQQVVKISSEGTDAKNHNNLKNRVTEKQVSDFLQEISKFKRVQDKTKMSEAAKTTQAPADTFDIKCRVTEKELSEFLHMMQMYLCNKMYKPELEGRDCPNCNPSVRPMPLPIYPDAVPTPYTEAK